jgi:hypothetical protein
MSKLSKILSIIFDKEDGKKSHMTGSAAAMSNISETFVHCGCMDGDKIHDVTVHESFNGPSRKRKMCMFHVEIEIEKGKIVSFD